MSIPYKLFAKESLVNFDSFVSKPIDIRIYLCYLMYHRLIHLNHSTAKKEGYIKW